MQLTSSSSQVYYLTTYSLGLRLSESLSLRILDVDGHLMRVHLRYTKSKKDRLVPATPTSLNADCEYVGKGDGAPLFIPQCYQ